MIRVGLLEDETDLRMEVTDFLRSEGYETRDAGTIAEFMLLTPQCDIAVIDVGLPDGNGFAVAEALRKSQPHIGIIMLTARGSIDDRINGLKGGADHYLVKPIKLTILSAHIAALARRVAPSKTWQLSLIQRHLLSPEGNAIKMSALEMILLELLARNAGKVVHRPSIASAFGSDWIDYDERHLDQLVSRLRRRWLKQTGAQLPLKTEHGQGYSFCVDIQVT
jgi:two-component system OmpR family response regulator